MAAATTSKNRIRERQLKFLIWDTKIVGVNKGPINYRLPNMITPLQNVNNEKFKNKMS